MQYNSLEQTLIQSIIEYFNLMASILLIISLIKLPMQTIVWFANQDRPMMDNTCKLAFDDFGNMLVVDARGSVAMITYGFGAATGTAVTLLDSGNLVLRDVTNSSSILWQSFDYPTDTLLPGMKLGMAGMRNRLLISWKSSSDPSPGVFTFGANPNGTKQLLVRWSSTVYWDTGVWDGRTFPLVDPGTTGITAWIPGEDYFSYSVKEGYPMTRYVINISGKLQLISWLESEKEWILLSSEPRPQCDVYNLCGNNGVCYEHRMQHCQCLEGFEPGSKAEWQSGVTKGGCIRTNSLNCGSNGTQDRFVLIANVKFPVNAKFMNGSNRDECESLCLKDCSCSAYTFMASNITNGCRMWYGNLRNMRLMEKDTGEGEFYLRLSAFGFGSASSHALSTWLILVIVAASSFLGSLVLVSSICFCRRRRKERVRRSQEQSIAKWGAEIAGKLTEQGVTGPDFTLFCFPQIKDATDNFSDENKLGEGGFGSVYKGKLLEGKEVAVKRLSTCSGQGLEEFKNEIILIPKLQHRNLVRLLGCCIQWEEKILVYEYMKNKSLDYFLFEPTRGAQLDWSRRFNIVKEIAQGLLYLHKHSRLRVIHRDLKASNILLDDEMRPKISDFGLARIVGTDDTQANTKRVAGTYGYISPEYASKGVFYEKSDIYSFGVLLLEIVSGKKNAGFHQTGNSSNLLDYAWDLWREGRWMMLVDPVICHDAPCHAFSLKRCIHAALLCVQDNASDRPNISEVIVLLSNENSNSTTLTIPKKPAFYSLKIEDNKISSAKETSSLYFVSMTAMDAR
ncbi:S-receptor-like serine/threonine-protein kinase protein [Dioscorea alata]|uniref:S-receptor-like serine/threonine-protein kinase protein n=1 Tax=Dioscorea alata TaxID=55571 RepID=A0ACB7UPF0_DIOAL|nr:S-receptor-like serine/threonine-protein kinase protein [Dioscorea alata]